MNSTGGTHTPAIPRRRSPFFRRWSCTIQQQQHSVHAKANASPVNFRHCSPKPDVSARKLAAELWQFCFLEVTGLDSKKKFNVSLKEEDWAFRKSNNVAKKKTRQEMNKIHGERKVTADSVISALLSELLRAQTCINDLRAENKSCQSMLGELEDKLGREKRSRERMEKMNATLVRELAKANLCANQIRASYEDERKQRELIEQVCSELAMQIGEDKAKLERLESDFVRIQEEFEQERSMFEMVDLWRQESIQMKLADARMALEDKHNQMIKLVAYLQDFLRSRGVDEFEKADEELRRGLLLKERVIKVDSPPPNLNALSSTIHIVSLDNEDQTSVASLIM
ncbi:hypothetical protein PIB30_033537 [Stylosanthes scabra]|uniref:Uncharacterized protein n=1 Tax=Stylosanthes scabra TaxID=79078 RepID=A0ABU6TC79_9FABA|nr:hypothetical protein [Stylosanthes scabra]